MKIHPTKLAAHFEQTILTGLATVLVVLSCVPIAARWLGRTPPPWIEPLLGIVLLWLTLAGAWAATGAQRHICIDLVSHLLPPAANHRVRPWIHLFTTVVALALAWFGLEFIRLQRSAETARLFGVPIWGYSYAIPLAMVGIAWRSLWNAWQEFRGATPTTVATNQEPRP